MSKKGNLPAGALNTVKSGFSKGVKAIREGLIKLYFALEKSKMLTAIKKGFVTLIPVFIVGALCLAILNFPVTAVQVFIKETFLKGAIGKILLYTYYATFGMSGLYLLLTVTFRYSQNFTEDSTSLRLIICIAAAGAYIAMLGPAVMSGENLSIQERVFDRFFGVRNIFASLFCSISATRLYILLFNLIKKLYRRSATTDTNYTNAIRSIFPLWIVIGLYAVAAIIIALISDRTGINARTFPELITYILSLPFKYLSKNFGSAFLIILFQTVFWFFGIHGGNVLDHVTLDIFATEVTDAVTGITSFSGELLTKRFFDVFVLIGGCGMTLSLIIAILLFSKSKSSKQLSRSSLLPQVFNINETMVYGLPIVLNPVFVIPFVITPLVNLTISYAVISWGWVPLPAAAVDWTAPVILSGVLSTGSVGGALLQIFNIALGVLIYMPFVKLNDRIRKLKHERVVEEMTDKLRTAETDGTPLTLLKGDGDIAMIARELALDLRESIKNKTVQMFYQPQVDIKGKVISCEALLRWKNPNTDKFLFPPLILAIAREDGSLPLLNDCIIDIVLEDAAEFNVIYGGGFSVSINFSADQFENLEFIKQFVQKVKDHNLLPDTVSVEVTEEKELRETENTPEILSLLTGNHIKIAIDDFSMGYTSLSYLQNYNFSYIKLDGQMVKSLMTNDRIRNIIRSITALGDSLNFEVIAEFVETEEQRQTLEHLGCYIYQGYLYSPAVTKKKLFEFIENRNYNN